MSKSVQQKCSGYTITNTHIYKKKGEENVVQRKSKFTLKTTHIPCNKIISAKGKSTVNNEKQHNDD